LLSLSRKEYEFKGIVDGIETTYLFDVKNTPTLPSDIGRNVQIYEGNQLYQFVFEDRKMPTKFVHSGEFMYQLSKKNN